MRFVTETGVAVWAILVMILPCRYLLHIGYSLGGVSLADPVRTVNEAIALAGFAGSQSHRPF